MKSYKTYLAVLLSFAIMIVSCAPPEEFPTDVAGLSKAIAEKKSEMKVLQEKMDTLQFELDKLMPKKEKEVAVNILPLQKRDFKSYVKIQGSVTTDEVVMASSETGGRIVSMTANEGDYVQSGQLLASVDVESINKQLEEVETSYELAKTVFERQERLWNQKIGSELQYLEAKNGKERLEKTMETIKSQLKKKDVFAPISGYIDMVFLKQGEMSGPGTPIVQILNTGVVKIVADVPENYLGSIKRGDYVDVYFPALDKNYKKKVSMIGRSIDPSNRTFKIEMSTSNPGGTLKPNLLAELDVVDTYLKDQVIIPLNVIKQEVTGKRYVFVVNRSDDKKPRAKKVYITSGDSYENDITITEGLMGDEELITKGVEDLENNSIIIIEETIAEANE